MERLVASSSGIGVTSETNVSRGCPRIILNRFAIPHIWQSQVVLFIVLLQSSCNGVRASCLKDGPDMRLWIVSDEMEDLSDGRVACRCRYSCI